MTARLVRGRPGSSRWPPESVIIFATSAWIAAVSGRLRGTGRRVDDVAVVGHLVPTVPFVPVYSVLVFM